MRMYSRKSPKSIYKAVKLVLFVLLVYGNFSGLYIFQLVFSSNK